jgi:hypothetical protein
MAKLSYATIFMAKLNHGLNISCKFLSFICQIYLNIFLASYFILFYFIWNKYNDIYRYYIFKFYYLC